MPKIRSVLIWLVLIMHPYAIFAESVNLQILVADSLFIEREYEMSNKILDDQLPILLKNEDWENYVGARVLQYQNYLRLGIYSDILERTLPDARKHLSIQSSLSFNYLLNNLALQSYEKGNIDKAIALFDQVRLQHAFLKKNNSNFYTRTLNNLGLTYKRKGDFAKATIYYQEGQKELKNKLETAPEYQKLILSQELATSHNNIAQIHNLLAAYPEAESALRQTLKIHEQYLAAYPDLRLSYGRYCINFAHHFQLREMYDSAAVYLAGAKEFIGGNTRQIQRYHKFLGVNYFKQGKYGLAETQFRLSQKYSEALPYAPKNYGGLHERIAGIYRAKNDSANALLELRHALAYYADYEGELPELEEITLQAEALKILFPIGRLLAQKTEKEMALQHYCLAIDLLHEMRQSFDGRQSKHFLSEQHDAIYEEALALAFELYHKTEDKKYLRIAFRIAEQSKAALLLEAANQAEAIGHSALPPQLRDSLYALKLDIAFFERKIDPKIIAEQQEALHDRLFQLKQTQEDLLKFIEQNYPTYHQLKYQATVLSLDSIQARLCSENRDVVSYFYGEESVYVFHLQATEINFYQIEKKENTDQVLLAFVQLISSNEALIADGGLDQFKQLSHDIYLTFGDLFFTTKSTSTLVIPDGPLAFLPFDLLLSSTAATSTSYVDLPYLLHQKTLSYAFSASLASRILLEKKGSKGILSMAPFPEELRYSQVEMDYLQEIAATETLVAAQANTDNFLAKAKEFQVLHLSTHARGSGEPSIQFHDGPLALSTLFALNLKADLAVLSVCEGNMGKDQAGEGVQSLASGFAYAGVPSLLASLWAVNDRSTADILQAYYKQLAEGADKATALQKAKIAYLEQVPNEALASPYYWAAFVQLGATEPISLRQDTSVFLYFLLVLGLGFVLWLGFVRNTSK